MFKSKVEDVKNEILDIVKTLKEAGKVSLAKCIEDNWDKTGLTYSRELNIWEPERPMEQELQNAFGKELDRLETPSELKIKILSSLEKRRVLQTGPHLGLTSSPRMLCINWLESLGIRDVDFDVVAMFSGIPFSNQSRPGRINRQHGSINLLPSNMQNALVYKSLIPEKLVETVQGLPKDLDHLRKLLPRAIISGSYTKWALKGCENIERKILGKNNLVFLDINEVVTEYLLQVLENKDHIIYKIFCDIKINEEFMKMFPNEIMFYYPVLDGKFEKMENLVFTKGTLKSKHKEIHLVDAKSLIKELREGRLCPALITGFLVLAFLNEFKCFGSFAQVEYLPVYQKKLAQLKFLKDFHIEKVPTANLTTGSFKENPLLYPADAIINNMKFRPDENTLFGELLLPMKDLLT